MGAVKHNVDQWVEANKTFFLPPICNKMMHSHGQLKVSTGRLEAMWGTGLSETPMRNQIARTGLQLRFTA